MNIFALDIDQTECVRRYCDVHVRKMLLETAQILSTAVRVTAGTETLITMPNNKQRRVYLLPNEQYSIEDDKLVLSSSLYVQTHINHPCCVWARHSMCNFYWLWGLGMALDTEYQKRFGKKHKSRAIFNWIGNTELEIFRHINIAHESHGYKITAWPLCVDADLISNIDSANHSDVIKAYRKYYERKLADFKQRGLL